MAVNIYPLNPSNAHDACIIHHACFDKAWDGETICTLSKQGGGLILYISNQPVGFILWQQVLDIADILTVCVLPTHRQQGYAKHLLTQATTTMTGNGVEHIHLEVATTNSVAIHLYTQYGFMPNGVRKHYYDGVGDALQLLWSAV
jgi:[ribosomal protein S18]-alanine N-acetyltransferase